MVPSLTPIGCTFCPKLSPPLVFFIQNHRYVAGPLSNHGGPPHSPRYMPLEGRSAVYRNPLDHEGVYIHLVILLGVGHGGIDQLGQGLGKGLVGKGKYIQSLLHLFALHQLGHQSGLLRGNPHISRSSRDLHLPFNSSLCALDHPGLSIPSMAVKDTGGGKFTQFISHHILSDENGDEFFPVMDRNGQTHQFRGDGGPTRPCLNYFIACALSGLLDLFQKAGLDIGTFLERTCHKSSCLSQRICTHFFFLTPSLSVALFLL